MLIVCRTFVRQVVGIPTSTCATDVNCLSDKMGLLKNQRIGLIDPDTPKSAMSKTSNDGTQLELVVSRMRSSGGTCPDLNSSLMNSIPMDAPSTTETILIFRAWIFGMVSPRI